MLIRFFSKSYLVQFIVLSILLIALTLPVIFSPVEYTYSGFEYNNPLKSILISFFALHSIIPFIFNILMVGIGALLLNNSLANSGLIEKNSLLGAFFLVAFLPTQFVAFESYFLALGLLLVIIYHLCIKLFNKEDDFNTVFNIGLLISLALMISNIALLYLPVIWFAFFIYRIVRWREWVILHVGVLLPWFFLVVYYFISGQLEEAAPILTIDFEQFYVFQINLKPDVWEFPFVIVVTTLSLISLIIFAITQQDHVISIRKNMSVSWGFIILALLLIFVGDQSEEKLFLIPLLMILPIFISYALSFIRRKILAEYIIRLLLLTVVLRLLEYIL